ncbi:MAG: HEAT repeat domain-containing protein [Planctomycetota bacterium]|jgi:hypothetical protein
MRIAAIGATLLLALASCSSTPTTTESPFQQPNSLMAGEIDQRVEQIPYQHRDELLQNLLWLAQTGEQTIPSLLKGLEHENPKVRSSCAWVLGRLRDRRTIPNLQQAAKDSEPTVRMECARTLVLMGDLAWSPTLIEGLDSDRKEVRYLCHEALKTSSGHDFGYDHLNQNEGDQRLSVLRWRQWWSEYSGDAMFSSSYQQKYNLQPQVAAPGGEGKRMGEPAPQNTPNPSPANTPKADESPAPATGREPIGPQPQGGEAPAANGQPQQPNRR